MRADNSAHIIAAARRRSDDARRRAVTALRRLDPPSQDPAKPQHRRAAGKPTPEFIPGLLVQESEPKRASQNRPVDRGEGLTP
jgi:hypothetical protein